MTTQATCAGALEPNGRLHILLFTGLRTSRKQFIGEEAAANVTVVLIEELAGRHTLRTGIGFDKAVKTYRGATDKGSVEQSGGRLTEAASRLGLKHQTLSWILQNRHRELSGRESAAFLPTCQHRV